MWRTTAIVAGAMFVSGVAAAQSEGDRAIPAPLCYRINPGGGCCQMDDTVFMMPCPSGYASFQECLNVRNFCPPDVPDSGVEDATPPDAEPADAGPAPDALVLDGMIPRDAEPGDAPEPRDAMDPIDAGPGPGDAAEPADGAPPPPRDAAVPPDGSVRLDAGTPDSAAPPPDASAPADAGGAAVDSGAGTGAEPLDTAESSCGCATTPRSASSYGALAALALLLVARRRGR